MGSYETDQTVRLAFSKVRRFTVWVEVDSRYERSSSECGGQTEPGQAGAGERGQPY